MLWVSRNGNGRRRRFAFFCGFGVFLLFVLFAVSRGSDDKTKSNLKVVSGFTYVTPQQKLNEIGDNQSMMMRLSDRYFDSFSRQKSSLFTKERVKQEKEAWSSFYMALCSVNEPPSLFGKEMHEKGMVITCGGRYWSMCMANVRILVAVHGVTLPIEVWVDDEDINDPILTALIANYSNVIPRQFSEIATLYQAWLGQFRVGETNVGTKKFHLKVMALIGSNIKNVMYIDADSFPLRNPEYLFESSKFGETGAVFWPDMYGISERSLIWETMGIKYQNVWAQESGQMLIDKRRHWRQLLVSAFLNNRQDYYYALVNGDKDTFFASWIATNSSFFMLPYPPTPAGVMKDGRFCGNAFIQSDENRLPVFIHAVGSKDMLMKGARAWRNVKLFKPDKGYPYYRWQDGCIDISNAREESQVVNANTLIGNIEDAIKFFIKTNNA